MKKDYNFTLNIKRLLVFSFIYLCWQVIAYCYLQIHWNGNIFDQNLKEIYAKE